MATPTVRHVDASAFDYNLPDASIAQKPVEPRHAARLLVDRGPGAVPADRTVEELATLLRPGDVVVRNTTKVIPARINLRKPTGGAVEVLLLEHDAATDTWEALVRPSKKVAPGTRLVAGDDLVVEVNERTGDTRRVRLLCDDALAALDRHGAVPLPPYITESLADVGRYQTVYADQPGSVAAPTAGLHLTDEVFASIEALGVPVFDVELLVGLGTFRPIVVDDLDDHVMHEERYRVPEATWTACAEATRVVAIGTTTVRALESAAQRGELAGHTDLFLRPGSSFAVVGALLTNFHLPRSSLLAMVEAFIGPRWRDLYSHALADGYRFLSFGDAMFLERSPQ